MHCNICICKQDIFNFYKVYQMRKKVNWAKFLSSSSSPKDNETAWLWLRKVLPSPSVGGFKTLENNDLNICSFTAEIALGRKADWKYFEVPACLKLSLVFELGVAGASFAHISPGTANLTKRSVEVNATRNNWFSPCSLSANFNKTPSLGSYVPVMLFLKTSVMDNKKSFLAVLDTSPQLSCW